MSDSRKYAHYAKWIRIFAGLSAEEIKEAVHHCDRLYFRAGQTIYHKGHLGSTIFVVFDGIVNIEDEGYILAKCRKGYAFGEMSMLNHRPHCASATAATDVKLLAIDKSHTDALLRGNGAPRFLLNIILELSSRLENANLLIAKQRKTEHHGLRPAVRGRYPSS